MGLSAFPHQNGHFTVVNKQNQINFCPHYYLQRVCFLRAILQLLKRYNELEKYTHVAEEVIVYCCFNRKFQEYGTIQDNAKACYVAFLAYTAQSLGLFGFILGTV